MTDWIQAVSAAVTAVIAVAAGIFAFVQVRQAATAHFAERRPYVVPSLEVRPSDTNEFRVYLVIKNFGQTPAKNVVVEFENGANWNHISRAHVLPFMKINGGISVVTPHASNEFFIGPLSHSSPLNALRTESILATVTFRAYGHSRIVTDEFRLTLRDLAGSQRLSKARTSPTLRSSTQPKEKS
jgi:hypothetical protein